jgi:hypothetical protein
MQWCDRRALEGKPRQRERAPSPAAILDSPDERIVDLSEAALVQTGVDRLQVRMDSSLRSLSMTKSAAAIDFGAYRTRT